MRVVLKTLNEDSDKHDELFLELLSSADQMIEYFDNKKFDYYMLLHTDDTNLEDFLTGLKTATNTSQSIPSFLQHYTPNKQQELFKYCLDHRDEFEITSSQHLMLAIFGFFHKKKDLFNLYPEVIFIDITSDTNKEKRPLVTITGKTSTGHMFTL